MIAVNLMTHTLAYVYGRCMLWNMEAKQFADLNSQEFLSFAHRTHNVCWRYLHSRQNLDGSCSDFECTVALDARSLFHHHINTEI